MKRNIAEDLPARKHPQAAGGAGAPDKKGGEEKSADPAKKVKQAVYDIRYRARREELPLRQAYSQYMQNSSMGQEEKTLVKQKLFGKGGMNEDYNVEDSASNSVASAMFKVFVEGIEEEQEIELVYEEEMRQSADRKYKVRVTGKDGRSYVRMATREKINALRANPNIAEVEMTEHGDPYEGKKKERKLDPVGREDKDVDNDGDHDKSDKYLLNRRKAIGKAMAKEDYVHEVYGEGEEEKTIDVSKKKNKVVVNPPAPGPKGKGLMNSYKPEGEMVDEGHPEPKVNYLKDMDVYDTRRQIRQLAPGSPLPPASTRPGLPDMRLKRVKAKTDKKVQTAGYQPEGDMVDEGAVEMINKVAEKLKTSQNPAVRAARAVFGVKGGRGTARPVGKDVTKLTRQTNSVEMEGDVIAEKAVSKSQQRFMGMVCAAKKGKMESASAQVNAAAKSMTKKDACEFASTKHEDLPEEKKAEEKDKRADYAYRAMIKNKLRAGLGIKNPMVMSDPEKCEKDFDKVATADSVKDAMKEATYPSDFINPDGSKRGVAKPKPGRPIQHDEPTDRYGRRIQKGRV